VAPSHYKAPIFLTIDTALLLFVFQSFSVDRTKPVMYCLSQIMPIEPTDTFPLWSFGYATTPENDDPQKVFTTRGRTAEEAWYCLREITAAFREPEKVSLLGTVSIQDMVSYSRIHQYHWFTDAPLWLKLIEERHDLIWTVPITPPCTV
jgi:hypothetical protein